MSLYLIYNPPLLRFGAVAKWIKAAVCKTAIRGFESRPYLHIRVIQTYVRYTL